MTHALDDPRLSAHLDPAVIREARHLLTALDRMIRGNYGLTAPAALDLAADAPSPGDAVVESRP